MREKGNKKKTIISSTSTILPPHRQGLPVGKTAKAAAWSSSNLGIQKQKFFNKNFVSKIKKYLRTKFCSRKHKCFESFRTGPASSAFL